MKSTDTSTIESCNFLSPIPGADQLKGRVAYLFSGALRSDGVDSFIRQLAPFVHVDMYDLLIDTVNHDFTDEVVYRKYAADLSADPSLAAHEWHS